MNSLTVNLHLMMGDVSPPTKSRFKIMMEDRVPFETYAIKNTDCHHGLNPKGFRWYGEPRKGRTDGENATEEFSV